MKPETDFDAFLAGVPPADARRLQKILAEWARGDENGFPVQLALLTRAQLKASAGVPRLIEEQRLRILGDLEKLRAEIVRAGAGAQDAFRQQLLQLEAEVTRQCTALREANQKIHAHVTNASDTADRIQRALGAALREMAEAQAKVKAQHDRLWASVESLMSTLAQERFMARAAVVVVALGLGFLLGLNSTKMLRSAPTISSPPNAPSGTTP